MFKKFIFASILCSIWLFTISAFGYEPPVKSLEGFLTDTSGVLSESDRNQINQKLASYNQASKNEIGVLVISSLDGESIEDAAYSTFNTWGVGKKGLDNGVLLLVSINDRKMRIETGKGVEGELTDLQCSDIIKNVIVPHFKQKNYAKGIEAGVDGISSVLEHRGPASATGLSDISIVAIIILILFLFIVIAFVRRYCYSGSFGGFDDWGSGGSSGGDSFGGGESGGGGSSDSW